MTGRSLSNTKPSKAAKKQNTATGIHKVLVVGGTGFLGAPVVRRLKDDGYAVSIYTRDGARARARFGDDFGYAEGSATDVVALAEAMHGCGGVHINLHPTPREPYLEARGTEAIAEAAKRSGIARLSMITGASVEQLKDARGPLRSKWVAEEALRDSGVPYTIFRPSWFFESLAFFIRGTAGRQRATMIGRQPHPVPWLAASDYARMVSRSYGLPEAADKTLTIFGPRRIRMLQALRQYCEAVLPGVEPRVLPIWAAVLIGRFRPKTGLVGIARMMEFFDKNPTLGDPAEANELLGAPETTLEQWCAERKRKI